MRLFVGFTAFQTYIDPADIGRLRAKVGEKVQSWQEAGKLETGGIFAGNRKGFVVLNVASEDEAFELLGDLADFAVIRESSARFVREARELFRRASAEPGLTRRR
jgi:hypothetical protein